MRLIRRLGAYFVPYWHRIAVAAVCMAIVGATAGLSAWLVKPVLDEIFIRQDAWKLKLLPLLILGLYLLKGGCRYLQSYLMRWVGEAVVLRLRNDLVRQLQYRELAFHETHPTGALIARVTYDVEAMHRAIPDLLQILRQGVTVAGLLAVLFIRDWKLALLSLVIFPLAAYPLKQTSTLIRRYARRSQERIGDMASALQESFSGVAVIKVFQAEERAIGRCAAEGEKLRRVHLKSARLNEITAPFMEFLGAFGIALIIWYGGRQVLAGVTTAGNFFSFFTALFMLYDPLKRAGRFNNSFQQALAAAERVFEVMDQAAAPCETEGEFTLVPPLTEVTFEDVHFSYSADKGDVLRGVSFRGSSGEVVALVGASGAGKSTVLKLLPRLYEVGSGAVRINGRDVREYSVASLRRAMAVVNQEPFLFNDSIRNNILVGRPEATTEQVVAAARAAHAEGFILDLPDGYDTRVGERGELLSGGQRQRVAIARAILRDAPILILDEATSALDAESEGAVKQALERLMRSRATFVIAHRLSTVREASRIVVLRTGRVVESGTHDELLAAGGEYARLCRTQLAGDAAGG